MKKIKDKLVSYLSMQTATIAAVYPESHLQWGNICSVPRTMVSLFITFDRHHHPLAELLLSVATTFYPEFQVCRLYLHLSWTPLQIKHLLPKNEKGSEMHSVHLEKYNIIFTWCSVRNGKDFLGENKNMKQIRNDPILNLMRPQLNVFKINFLICIPKKNLVLEVIIDFGYMIHPPPLHNLILHRCIVQPVLLKPI